MADIFKIDEDHWLVEGESIRYSDSFGHSGWYWDQNGPYIFPPVRNSFLEVLDEVLGESTPKRTMPRGIN